MRKTLDSGGKRSVTPGYCRLLAVDCRFVFILNGSGVRCVLCKNQSESANHQPTIGNRQLGVALATALQSFAA